MLNPRSIVFALILLVAVSVIGVSNASAQGVKITSSSELGTLNGETLYREVDYQLELHAVPATNNQGGTYQWTIGVAFQFVSGTATSRTILIKWTSASSSNTVQVTHSGPNGTSSATLNVTVTTAAQRIKLTSVPCSQEGTIISGTAVIPTTISFVNTTNKAVRIFWLNYTGQRFEFITLNTGEGIIAVTWVGHPWLVSDENGSCLGIYQAIRQSGGVTVVNVSKVEFEAIGDGEPLSVNPNAEGGRRFYPDKKEPGEMAIRNQVRVKATVSQYLPNQKIYFRSFDVDDPSANTAPIDDDSGANANTEDNNGKVGTSRAGQLDSPASPACTRDATTNLWGCPVDANGTAIINFTTTMQPGDNFAVAASFSASYLAGITVNGTNLKDASMTTLPIPPEPNPATSYALLRGARSEMLTVWRKLHIEYDSMGIATGNNVTGAFSSGKKVPTGSQTLQLPTSTALEVNRFENGRMTIVNSGSGGTKIRSFKIVKSDISATPPVNANTSDTVTIFNNLATFIISEGDTFTLYDDDDVNDDGVLDGDEGDDVDEPDLGLLKSNDVPDLLP